MRGCGGPWGGVTGLWPWGGCSEKAGSWERLEGSVPDASGGGEVDREGGSKETATTFGPGQGQVGVSVRGDGEDFWGEGGSLGLDSLGVRYVAVSIMRTACAPEVTGGQGPGHGKLLPGWLPSLSWGQFKAC